jgi:hypothetical protein
MHTGTAAARLLDTRSRRIVNDNRWYIEKYQSIVSQFE